MVSDGGTLDLEAIKARAEAATPGPWRHVDYADPTGQPLTSDGRRSTFMGCGSVINDGGGDIAGPNGDCYPRGGYSPSEDMAFIAAARSDVPALVAEVERLRADLKKLRGDRILSVVFGHARDAPRPFALYRRQDVSGVSGTGVVALGAEWPDGLVVLRWTSEWPTSVVFHDRGIESVTAIHGHDGRTEIVWLSEELEPRAELEQERDDARAEVERLRRENAELAERLADLENTADEAEVEISEQRRERDELLLLAPAERDVIEAAKAYAHAWDVYANPSRHPGIAEEDRIFGKAHAQKRLIDATRAVDALSQPEPQP